VADTIAGNAAMVTAYQMILPDALVPKSVVWAIVLQHARMRVHQGRSSVEAMDIRSALPTVMGALNGAKLLHVRMMFVTNRYAIQDYAIRSWSRII
jgi:hypothetical protein